MLIHGSDFFVMAERSFCRINFIAVTSYLSFCVIRWSSCFDKSVMHMFVKNCNLFFSSLENQGVVL